MNLFVGKLISENKIEIEQDEAIHVNKVLRKKEGDTIMLTDGEQHLYETKILTIFKDKISCEIVKKVEHNVFPSRLSLAICPTKHNDRTEWMIEKCVEFGVVDFYFIESKNTERNKINVERWQKIANAAMKQSLRLQFPIIHPLQSFEKFMIYSKSLASNKMIAYCGNEFEKERFNSIESKANALIFVGPEGDFTAAEIEMCVNDNFKIIDLGNARLRSETAAVFFAALYF